ncbi:calcium-binding protein [Streptomyces sp. NPDC059524]|uniref:calcium-binding protein n=1 Tax=Streptomyces sp. NPDC059524 TaxID=3346856 RepID=UPI003698A5FC
MRIRATAAALTVSGALALTAFTVPVAQAVDGPQAAAAEAGTSAGADEQYGDTAISNVVVNGGKDVVAGISNLVPVKVTFTATDNSGIDNTSGYAVLYHGTDVESSDAGAEPTQEVGGATNCATVSATTATCTMTFSIDPQANLANYAAGSWKVWAIASGKDGDYTLRENAKTFGMKRYSKLTTNASPEPVKKGATITVTGLLSRANWDTYKYAGYTNQTVTLQYRPKTSTTYKTIKTITSSSTGTLKTTVTASADGYFRYKFAGTSTTPAVTSTSDFVDVQ